MARVFASVALLALSLQCVAGASAQTAPPSPVPSGAPTPASLPSISAMPAPTTTPDASGVPDASTDPFSWLESVNGARAQAWVKAENAKSLGVLTRDPHYATFYDEALAIGQAKDRIPAPEILNGRIYNFWQDAQHVRGIWRTTTFASYATAAPAWTTILDLDRLAAKEGKNWVFHGANCNSPSRKRCLIDLSEGGEDAVTVREFDLARGAFVPGGFVLPHGKQTVAWGADDDTILVAREWEKGDLTASGYPFITKTLKRGQALADAVELARGTTADVSASPFSISDGTGDRAQFVRRGVSFFQSETSIVTPSGLKRLAIPLKANVTGVLAGRLLVSLDEPWTTNGATYPEGALVSMSLAAALRDPAHLKPTVIYAPGPRETFEGLSATRDRLIVTSYRNVTGRAAIYTPVANGGWTMRALDLPANSSIGAGSGDDDGARAFISVTSFLAPTTLSIVDTTTGAITKVKSTTPKFDASREAVEQHFATSKDGTQIPYFVVHPKAMKYDGTNPTILYAYGGFGVSLTPSYSGVLGKLWLERGGVYVLANIRGGGEFGPKWHEAGLKTNRQRIYDDFAAVGRALVAAKITSPKHLGIEGGSNGGLLMGVEFTQHPELWNAVDIQVPLLDMLRFEKIEAGASWVGEYGSVSIPEQRTFLASISPYNNLHAATTYPEPFIWTTTKDDRVGPEHARKFAAKLAALHKPYLFYEVTEGGHGAGANIKEGSMTSALEYTYFTRRLIEGAAR
jgi:prolyl oligopeptidase